MDLTHLFGKDLATTATGDLALSDGPDLGNQLVLRRLLTNPADYWWENNYGAGLRSLIGKAVPTATIQGTIQAQAFLESAVARQPSPSITVTPDPSGTFGVKFRYTNAQSGGPQLLNFDVSP